MIFDLRIISRKATRDLALTMAKVAMFAIGIGGGTVFFSLVDGLHYIQRRYPNGDRLVALGYPNDYANSDVSNLSYKTYDDLKQTFPLLDEYGGYTLASQTLQREGASEIIQGAWVTPNFFHLLGTRPELGRLTDTPGMYWRDSRWMLISHALWQSKFAEDRQVVGKIVHLDGKSHAVLGVLPADFLMPGFTSTYAPQYFVPFEQTDLEPGTLDSRVFKVLARNGRDVNLSTLQHEIMANPATTKRLGGEIKIVPLRNLLIGSALRAKIWLLNAAAVFAICLVIVNISLLCLAQGVAWKREFAVMSSLGASFPKLVGVLLLENIVQVLVAAPVGVLASIYLQRALIATIPENLGLKAEINFRVFAGVAAICLLFCFVASVIPVLRLWRADVWSSLQPQTRSVVWSTGSRSRTGISWLVAGEVALVCVFMFISGLLLVSHWRRDTVGRGPYVDHIYLFTAKIKPEKYAKRQQRVEMFQNVATRLRALPGVESVGITGFVVPDETRPHQVFWKETDNPGSDYPAQIIYRADASVGYFQTLGIAILRGRSFDSGDRELPSQQVLVISQETAKRYWPNEDPLGKRIRIGRSSNPLSEIVGVSQDLISAGQNPQALPMAWRPLTGRPFDSATYIVRMARGVALRHDSIDKAVSALDNEVLVYGPNTLRQDIADFQWEARFLALVYAMFGAVIYLLSVLGVYSLVLYDTTKRMPEFALRKALGAGHAALGALLWRAGTVNVLLGSFIGIGIGVAAALKLQSFLYRTSATEVTVIGATIALAGIAAFAGYCRPAFDVMKSDPNKILRSG